MDSPIRFLIDNAISPMVAEWMRQGGLDAVHLRERGIASVEDEVVFELAAGEDRVIVSLDTDFGTILAQRQTSKPSVILLRGKISRRPRTQFDLLMKNLPQIEQALREGSIVVFEHSRIRIRALPMGSK